MSGGSPLGRVLGHGTAHAGSGHWWLQRLTALALLVLAPWFLYSLATVPLADHAAVAAWAAHPWHAIALALLVGTACWHASLGLQVVIEDYVHGPAIKLAALLLARFACITLAATGLFAVLKLALAAP
ncbi:MAG: hypothetical protein RL026_274 [Pseudomonadota bacterium]|jgi:succinate dehydrogenase / fumarate reductase membrane anchor subunit